MAQPGWRSYLARVLGWLRWSPVSVTVYYGPTDFRDKTARATFDDETDRAQFRDKTARAKFEREVAS